MSEGSELDKGITRRQLGASAAGTLGAVVLGVSAQPVGNAEVGHSGKEVAARAFVDVFDSIVGQKDTREVVEAYCQRFADFLGKERTIGTDLEAFHEAALCVVKAGKKAETVEQIKDLFEYEIRRLQTMIHLTPIVPQEDSET